MPPSSDSVSSTSLPLGADIHSHAIWRRSSSIPRSVNHEQQPAIYDQGPQTYPAFIADAQASHAMPHRPNAPIPPSSIRSIPKSHKKFLRQHRILFRVLIGVFHLSLIALTVAIVLGAVNTHQHGNYGAKCTAIIVGVLGFSGMVGSAAVIWLISTGRKEKARLEKRWADDERLKEARSVNERWIESGIRESIKDRERSLSRSLSRGRERDRIIRPAATRILSFRAMTPTPTPSTRMPDQYAQPASRRVHSPWPRPMDVPNNVDDDPDNATDEENKKPKDHRNVSNHSDNNSDEDDDDKDDDRDGPDEEGKNQVEQNQRDSALKDFLDLDPSDSNDENNHETKTASRSNTAILEGKPLSKVSLPFDDSKPLPPLPDSAPTSPFTPNSNNEYTNSSPFDRSSTALGPYSPPRVLSNEQAPFNTGTVRSNELGIGNARDDNSTSLQVPRCENGKLGSVQSDENFLAMYNQADGADSEDEKDRRLRREKSRERVEAWKRTANSGSEEEAEGERAQKRKKLKEAVERGIQRVATRKKERRGAVVGSKAGVRGEGHARPK